MKTKKSDQFNSRFKHPREWFLNESYYGSTLSQRITKLELQDQVIESVRINLEQGSNLLKLSRELSQYTTEESATVALREMERQAKRLASGSDLVEFKRFLSDTKDEIATAIESQDFSQLEKIATKVSDKVESFNDASLEETIADSIDRKALNNAFRIAATETNKAYNRGVHDRALADPDCEAIRLDLSTGTNNCDECVEYANQDNGAGPGIYRRDDCPETPLHPFCRCHLTPVFVLPEGVTEEDLDDSGLSDDQTM